MKRGCAAACAAVIAVLLFVPPSQAFEMTLMTGREKGTYYQFGLDLQQLTKSRGIELEVQPSTGSIENLYAVFQRPRTQVGIVQSDVLAFVTRVQSNPTLVRIAQKTKLVFPCTMKRCTWSAGRRSPTSTACRASALRSARTAAAPI